MKQPKPTEMKTAAQHNAENTGSAELIGGEAVTRIQRDDANLQLMKAKDEVERLRQLLNSAVEQRDNTVAGAEKIGKELDRLRAEHKANQKLEIAGVAILPGGARVCLANITSYDKGGDAGIHFQLSGGTKLEWTPGTRLCSYKDREGVRDRVLAELDKLLCAVPISIS